jgi:hypothetical protein
MGATLHEDIDAKPARTGQTVRHIARANFLEVVHRMLVIGNEVACNAPGVLTGEGSRRASRGQLSVDLHQRRFSRGKEQIADLP